MPALTRGALALAFLLTVPLANVLVTELGTIPVGFGLVAPAAVIAVGIALALRDAVQRLLGKLPAVGLIAAGCVLSYLVADPRIAVASAVAFVVAELLDLAVFSALEARLALAVLVSGLVGGLVDSLLFLQLAFGSLEYLPGQLVGKGYATVAATGVALLVARRRA